MFSNYTACAAFTLDPAQDGQPCHVTPGDRGGATAYGITQATYSRWIGRPALVADMTAIAGDVYRRWYWKPIAGDSLPIGVDLMVFDHGVVDGENESARLLQQAIGLSGSDVDGIIGPYTLGAVSTFLGSNSPFPLIDALVTLQATRYRSLTDYHLFGNDWDARLARRHAAAAAMVV